MGEDSTQIHFPALSYDQEWLGAIESLDGLSRPSRLAVKKGFYKQLVLVDSSLREFRIVSFKKIRTLFRFSFRGFLELIDRNPRWLVEITLGPPSGVSLDEVKRLISTSFAKRKDFWEEMADFEEFRGKIATASSMAEIFAIFRQFNQL